VATVAEPPSPVAAGPGATGRRSWRPVVIVAAAGAAILLLAVLADGRLLVADPDPSAVTAADVRLARSLFSDVAPPESLAEACFADDGAVDPACLDGGGPGRDGELTAEVIPRACRDEGSVSAACIERELGIDIPGECVHQDGDLDVGCLAGRGSLLVLTDRCLDDGRLRAECLDGRVFGVPDPGTTDGRERPSFVPEPTGDRVDPPEQARPDDTTPDRPEDEDEVDEGSSGLERIVDALSQGLGWLLLVVLLGALLAAAVLVVTRWRPGRLAPVIEPDLDDDAHDRAVMAASLDAGAHQLDLSGDPRQAIIAAYAMLLEGLAACAQERHPAETPLEHLERVLAALDVRPEPLRDLTTLFGEARFSDHPMTTRHVDRARAALEAAAADLDRVRETVG
jgi:hypothetical protein